MALRTVTSKLSEEELLEGDTKHVGFIGIIDQLTIDDSNRQQREIQTLRVEKSNWEVMRKDLDRLEKMFNEAKSITSHTS